MDILIRPAQPEDMPQMCDLLAELFTIEADFTPDVEKQVRGLSMLLTAQSGTSLVLVAEKDGAVVGMASVQTLVSTAEGGRVGLVEDVIVERKFNGQGIGTLLLKRVIEWSLDRKLKRLQLLADKYNLTALDFYNRRGWQMTSLVGMRKML